MSFPNKVVKVGAFAGLVSGLCMANLLITLNASYGKIFWLFLFSLAIAGSYFLLGLLGGIVIDLALIMVHRIRKSPQRKKDLKRLCLAVAGLTGIVYSVVIAANLSYYEDLLNQPCVLLLKMVFAATLIGSIAALLFSFVKHKRITARHFAYYLAAVCLINLVVVVIHPFGIRKARTPERADINLNVENKAVNSRVLVIGIDSATWTVMNPMLEKGQLPNFKKLMDSGAYGPLKPFIPTSSPIIWTSIATGKKPENHQILDFFRYSVVSVKNSLILLPKNPDFLRIKKLFLNLRIIRMDHIVSSMRNSAALWEIIPHFGGQADVINWFVTYPAEPVNGHMVSDLFYRSRESHAKDVDAMCYPPSLHGELTALIEKEVTISDTMLQRFINPPLDDVLTSPYARGVKPAERLKMLLTEDEAVRLSANHLCNKDTSNLMAVYFQGLDLAGHLFWMFQEPEYFKFVTEDQIHKYGNLIEEYYRYMDEVIGDVIASANADTVVIISDHGMEHVSRLKSMWIRLSNKRLTSGCHDRAPDGIFIISGKNIKTNTKLDSVSPFDLTPTVLALMNLPVAEDMDGRVVTEVFEETFLQNHPIRKVSSYDSLRIRKKGAIEGSIDEEMKERLRSLGYIE